ncbi:MAG: hypothetical protein LBI17_01720 [Rickettsiales bacterium]|jgi:hypothetical protein|nr:hypothetical protein [Rickettsiales bacterium]
MLSGYKWIFRAAAIVAFALAARAQDGVDYSRPYDQIVAQVSNFESRHSLMPKEISETVATIEPKAGEAEAQAPAAAPAEAGATISPRDGSLPAEPVTVRSAIQAAPVARAEEFPAAAGGETERRAEEAPIILKPIHIEHVEMPSAYREENGMFVPLAPAPIIEEHRGDAVERPLLVGPRKPQLIVPGSGAHGVGEPDAQVPSAPARPAPAAAPDGASRAMAHVASYNTEEGAMKGAGEIEKKYPRAALFEARVNYEYAKDKGYFYRLYFAGDRRELEYLCREMKANNDWCWIR